jgi:hypothetical protein
LPANHALIKDGFEALNKTELVAGLIVSSIHRRIALFTLDIPIQRAIFPRSSKFRGMAGHLQQKSHKLP